MDLWGKKVANLKRELEELSQREAAASSRADELEGKASRTSERARERQRKVSELQDVIDDLRGEVARLRNSGASSSDVSSAQQALDEAMSVHGRSTR